jgi:zinc transport system substrate-binding protein
MKRHSLTVFITLLVLLSSFVMVRADRLTVVASIFPLFDFAREVAGTDADVRMLLPAGVEPHTWEPTPTDILRMSRADVFLYIGPEMEPWAQRILRTVETDGLWALAAMSVREPHGSNELRHTHEGSHDEDPHEPNEHRHAHKGPHGEDPHIWLDLGLAADIVEEIGRVLSEMDPGNKSLYTQGAGRYAGKLKELDRQFAAGLRECESRTVVTGGHAAFGHLTERYHLDQVPIYGVSPDAEPSPRYLAEIIKTVRDKNVKAVFFEDLVNPRLAQVISEETGARLLVLNPGGNLTADQWAQGITFLDIMNRNLANLREGLICE